MALTITGCISQQRVSGAPTLNVESSDVGGEGSMTFASGDEGIMAVAAGSGRGGNLGGGSALFGLEGLRLGQRVGTRFGVLAGPAFVGQPDGGVDTTMELRGSFGLFGIVNETDAKYTIGAELFMTNIGFDKTGTLVGIGLSVGRITEPKTGRFSATRDKRSTRHVARR